MSPFVVLFYATTAVLPHPRPHPLVPRLPSSTTRRNDGRKQTAAEDEESERDIYIREDESQTA